MYLAGPYRILLCCVKCVVVWERASAGCGASVEIGAGGVVDDVYAATRPQMCVSLN
jgi:hypothetical protein